MKLIIANWKMNPVSSHDAKELFGKIRRTAQSLRFAQCVVCPPFLFLSDLARMVRSTRCAVGAQDVFWKEEGAYTGEISPVQLDRFGVRYVIVGHSERRALGDSNDIVSMKLKSCFRQGISAVLCVGEQERDTQGAYFDAVRTQLTESLSKVSLGECGKLVIAYEPVWAIGVSAKRADTPEALFEMCIFIRKVLRDIFNKKVATETRILYGGSVNEENASGFLKDGGVSGLLVGHASLDAKVFGTILKQADKIK